MKNLSVRTRHATAALALLGTAFLYHLPVLAAGPDHMLLWSVGEFELGNGDTKLIVDGKVPEPYRVCVSKVADAAPLKIRYDGAERLVAVGDCADVTGEVIRLSAGGHLKAGEVLIGEFEHLRK